MAKVIFEADDPSYTIAEFCAAERMSRGKLYDLWNKGMGPRWFNIGSSRRISHEARIAWRRKLEAEAELSNGHSHDSKAEARPE